MESQEEGFRFHPTDFELITFLVRFFAKKDLRDNDFITMLDVYKQEPWVTYGYGSHCGREDDGDTGIFRYFITPRHKRKENNVRFCRVVGANLGTWKQLDKGKRVRVMSNEGKSMFIGIKRSLSYDTKRSCCPDDGKWLMKEYEFSEAILRKLSNYDLRYYCICAIKKKSKKNSSPSSNVTTNIDFSAQEKVIEPRMDQGCYNAINPGMVEPLMNQGYYNAMNNVEPMVQTEVGGENYDLSRFSEIEESLENNDGDERIMWNEDHPTLEATYKSFLQLLPC